jgi:shikimate kinase
MKCVVLLGFSTTGKSSFLRHFRETHREALDTLDSDELIPREDGGHIYNVYLRFRDGQNTGPSIQAIEGRERECLRTAGPGTKPLLMASGPFLPIREPEWSTFVQRIRPVFFYLQKDPEDVLDGLLHRRARQLQDVELAGR